VSHTEVDASILAPLDGAERAEELLEQA